MGKDFRVGLMTGVVLAVVALIWVATRPSLSPRARIAPAGAAPSGAKTVSDGPLPWENPDVAEATAPVIAGPSGPSTPQETPDRQERPEIQQFAATKPPEATPPAVSPDLTIHEMNEPIKTTRFHIVRRGETLSSVARQYYGSPDKWRKIVTANQKAIKDPNRIALGTKLVIPE